MKPLQVALAFSGGGFRASAFALGTLSYLHRIRVGDRSLLSYAAVLSTVSGGTVTGARYALSLARNEDFEIFNKAVYDFMTNTDLVSLSLEKLSDRRHWQGKRILSLINAFADIYDKYLFDSARFGELMRDDLHLRHICFNSTDFSNGLQFRFQWSEKVINPGDQEPERGIIGNNYFCVPENAAAEIRLADVLAASSCFPGGFEPINFPSDFISETTPRLQTLMENAHYPVGLMDGGIADNQGIESILLADERMRRNQPGDGRALDLVIVTDVASPFMEKYTASTPAATTFFNSLTPALVLAINTILLAAAISGIVFASQNGDVWLMAGSAVVATCTTMVYFLGMFLKRLPLRFEVPESFLRPLSKLLRLEFGVYHNLVANRVNSTLKLINEVFLKHIRRLNYRVLYRDASWKNRVIMNAIYELKDGIRITAQKFDSAKLTPELKASPAIVEVVTRASSMGTTLWFTDKEIKDRMPEAIIASGQINTCWNLLEYVEKLKADPSNTNDNHRLLLEIAAQLRSDWAMFMNDPYFLTNSSERSDKPKQS